MIKKHNKLAVTLALLAALSPAAAFAKSPVPFHHFHHVVLPTQHPGFFGLGSVLAAPLVLAYALHCQWQKTHPLDMNSGKFVKMPFCHETVDVVEDVVDTTTHNFNNVFNTKSDK